MLTLSETLKRVEPFFRPSVAKVITFFLLCLLALFCLAKIIPGDSETMGPNLALDRRIVITSYILFAPLFLSDLLKIPENAGFYLLTLVYIYVIACLLWSPFHFFFEKMRKRPP